MAAHVYSLEVIPLKFANFDGKKPGQAAPNKANANGARVADAHSFGDIQSLQRHLGNQAVSRMMGFGGGRKSEIGEMPIQRMINNSGSYKELSEKSPDIAKLYLRLEEDQQKTMKKMWESETNYDIENMEQLLAEIESFQTERLSELYLQSRYFHTSDLDNYSGILSKGLDPSHGGVGGASEAEDEFFVETSKNFVHVATDRKTADEYGERLSEKGKNPKIARVFLDKGQRSKLLVDPMHIPEARKTKSLIPPEHIRPIDEEVEMLAPDWNIERSNEAIASSVLSGDEEGLIAPHRFGKLADSAYRRRRISFGGFSAETRDEERSEDENDPKNNYSDMAQNPEIISDQDFNELIKPFLEDQINIDDVENTAELISDLAVNPDVLGRVLEKARNDTLTRMLQIIRKELQAEFFEDLIKEAEAILKKRQPTTRRIFLGGSRQPSKLPN